MIGTGIIDVQSFIIGSLFGVLFTALISYLIFMDVLDNLKKNFKSDKE